MLKPQAYHFRAGQRPRFILLWGALVILLVGCRMGQPTQAMTSTNLSPLPPADSLLLTTPTIAPSATIVWFPPTATATLVPTLGITPSPTQRVETGPILFSDDFADGSAWSLGRTASTSIALGKNVLTLALNQPGGYLFSLRDEPLLSDFYLEITASPSLCRDQDEYGLLLRVSPALEFYRFSLSCDGQTRLDKYYQGKASSPQPWMLSGAVPPGAPSSSRLAIWALGKEMRFYVNDELQFSVNDPSLTGGVIGVFARSAGDNAVTISFSDLVVKEVSR